MEIIKMPLQIIEYVSKVQVTSEESEIFDELLDCLQKVICKNHNNCDKCPYDKGDICGLTKTIQDFQSLIIVKEG